MKISHGTIVDNVVTNVFAKFDDDRLWNEKALVLKNTNKKNNARSAWRPVSGSMSRKYVWSRKRLHTEVNV